MQMGFVLCGNWSSGCWVWLHRAEAAKSAIAILWTFAFFHHDNIPEEIIKQAAEVPMKSEYEINLKHPDRQASYDLCIHCFGRARMVIGIHFSSVMVSGCCYLSHLSTKCGLQCIFCASSGALWVMTGCQQWSNRADVFLPISYCHYQSLLSFKGRLYIPLTSYSNISKPATLMYKLRSSYLTMMISTPSLD